MDFSQMYDTDLLPDGSRFPFWEDETRIQRTLFVDQNAKTDSPDGSPEKPFPTIGEAAAQARPGDRVYIKKGRYYETIRRVTGGTDAAHMILFEGEDGAVITGAVDWKPDFVPSEGWRQTPVSEESQLFSSDEASYFATTGAEVWMGDLPRNPLLYENGYNPFLIMNCQTLAWVPKRGAGPKIMDPTKDSRDLDMDHHLMKRGLVFMDGKRMKQVVRPYELWEQEDVFWVDDTYKRIHLHLKNNGKPADHTFQITLLEQGFMPDTPGLGYLHFRNLSFEKFANPVKCPQYGAFCSNCGHHFILENCRFEDINSIGVDLGFLSHVNYHTGVRGYHIVRKCVFRGCGIGGISAVPTQGKFLENMLVEDNLLEDNGFLNAELLYESAAIKSHYTHSSLYRRNIIRGMEYGMGIWLDKCNSNTRICCNIVQNLKHVSHGGIFDEATLDPVLVDHNLVMDVHCHITARGTAMGGHGIYEHECENMMVWENVVINTQGDSVHFHYTLPAERRFLGEEHRVPMCRNNVAVGNILYGGLHGVALSSEHDFSDGNKVLKPSISAFINLQTGENHGYDSIRTFLKMEETVSDAADVTACEDGAELRFSDGRKEKVLLCDCGALIRAFNQEANSVQP